MAAIHKLIDGYRRFHHHYFNTGNQLSVELSQSQRPSTLVIACSDSRVDPAIVMDCKPGDLFVIRNVANLVPTYEGGGGYLGVSAALEFGVRVLEVQHIIVLGHRQCGDIKALLEGIPEGLEGEFITPWVSIAKRARDRVNAELAQEPQGERLCECEMAGIVVSVDNPQTFPWIKARMAEGRLKLHGWYFDIISGEIKAYDMQKLKFEALV